MADFLSLLLIFALVAGFAFMAVRRYQRSHPASRIVPTQPEKPRRPIDKR